MSAFKVGDRIVSKQTYIVEKYKLLSKVPTGVITQIKGIAFIVKFDTGELIKSPFPHLEEELELEEIYNSPLYQALR